MDVVKDCVKFAVAANQVIADAYLNTWSAFCGCHYKKEMKWVLLHHYTAYTISSYPSC